MCKHSFTGEMAWSLAEAGWSRVCANAEEDDEIRHAACNLASSLSAQGRYAEAEAMQREVLAVEKRALGEEHPDTLVSAGNVR
jgi:hypothetical protein